jgi:hypothetical protein
MAKRRYGIAKTLTGIERIIKRAGGRLSRATMAIAIRPGQAEIPIYLTIKLPRKGTPKK